MDSDGGHSMDVMAGLFVLARDFSLKMQKKNIAAFAGSCAYFFIISLIPLLIVITSLVPYIAITENDLVQALKEITPAFADDIVVKLIGEAYEQSTAIFSISIIVSLWAGALGMLAIIRGLNCIYDVDERRNYFLLRFIAALYTVAMIIILGGMLLLMVFEKQVKSIVIAALPRLTGVISFLTNFRFVVVIGAAIFLFALIYTYVPSAKMRFVYQIPGAVFSAVVWYIFSLLFSVYVNNTGTFSVYGSITTPIILMVWLYFCIYIFLIGAFINKFFHPAVKLLYDDRHQNKVRKNVKRKSTKVLRKPRKYNEFG